MKDESEVPSVPSPWSLVLVTGATGLVGSHVVQRLLSRGLSVRALVRDVARASWLQRGQAEKLELVTGSLADPGSLQTAASGVSHVVHCAAKVGDWGAKQEYRRVNVDGLQALLTACRGAAPNLERFVHISSLGVYEARDHYGTDESESPSRNGIDGYTLSKIEAEELLFDAVQRADLPGVVLRPGFVYGPHDRTVLPRLVQKIRDGSFAYLGSGQQLLNNVGAENLAQAVELALFQEQVIGEAFNITDGRLVSRREFVGAVCAHIGCPEPQRHVPLAMARPLAVAMERLWRLLRRDEAPLLCQARIKFLGLNLDFSIDKARQQLGYAPAIDFREGLRTALQSVSSGTN